MNLTIDFTNIYNFLMSNILIKPAIYFIIFLFIDLVIYNIIFNFFCFCDLINRDTAYVPDDDPFCPSPPPAIVCFILTTTFYILTILATHCIFK